MKLRIDLKVTELENLAVEELLLGKNQLKVIDDGFQELKVDTPEWVIDRMAAMTSEINGRVKATLQKRLRAAKSRRAALRTADEKRNALDAEILELSAKIE